MCRFICVTSYFDVILCPSSHQILATPLLITSFFLVRVLAMALCLSVSVTSRSSIETAEPIDRARFVAWEPPSTYLILCKKEIRVSPKIRVLPSGTLFQTPDFKKFAWAYRSSKRVIDLARERRTRSESDKLGRRRSKKLTVPPSSDARPLVYHSNHQTLSTAQFRRACQLVTADSCRQLRNCVALFNRN